MVDSNPPLYADYGPYEYEPGLIFLSKIVPQNIVDCAETFPLEMGDVVIATYPKSGTMWTQEMASRIFLDNDPQALKVDSSKRVFHIERKTPVPGSLSGMEQLSKLPPPRLMKTHLGSRFYEKQLAERKAKFIVVMRNVKDNLVSFYHFHRALFHYQGTWDDFFEAFKAKQLMWGDWLDYNLGWWALRDQPNVLILKYEDMKRNRRQAIKTVAEFCGKNIRDEMLDKITEATSFEAMKDNPATNFSSARQFFNFNVSHFMRKGVVGDWKEHFTDEQNAYVEEHYVKEAASNGLDFEYTI